VITVVVVTDAVLVFVRVKSRDISFENALFDSAPAVFTMSARAPKHPWSRRLLMALVIWLHLCTAVE